MGLLDFFRFKKNKNVNLKDTLDKTALGSSLMAGQQKVVEQSIIKNRELTSKQIKNKEGYVRVGFVDKTDNFVIKPIFFGASEFAEGHAIVDLGNEWAVIDDTGGYTSHKYSKGFGSYCPLKVFENGIAELEVNSEIIKININGIIVNSDKENFDTKTNQQHTVNTKDDTLIKEEVLELLKQMDNNDDFIDSHRMSKQIRSFNDIVQNSEDICIPLLLSRLGYFRHRSDGGDYAAFALGLLGSQALPQLIDSYEYHKKNDNLDSFFQAIGEIGDPEGLDLLFKSLKDQQKYDHGESWKEDSQILIALSSVSRCVLNSASTSIIQQLIDLFSKFNEVTPFSSDHGGYATTIILFILLNNLDKPEASMFIESLDFDEKVIMGFDAFVSLKYEYHTNIDDLIKLLDKQRLSKTLNHFKLYENTMYWTREGKSITNPLDKHYLLGD